MIRHIVLLKWQENVSDADVQKLTDALSKMPAQVPEIKYTVFGPDLGMAKGNADYALVTDFENAEDFKKYVVSQAHQDLNKNVIGNLVASFITAQFQLPSA